MTKPDGTLISVPFLRLEIAKDGDSPILHRVITSTVGRPLWEYKDDKELARGFIAVLLSTYRFYVNPSIILNTTFSASPST